MNPSPYPFPQQPSLYQRNRNFFKGLLIAALTLTLMIPTFFINNLIEERKVRNEEVKQQIANQWSKPQTVVGPVWVLPYWLRTTNSQQKGVVQKNNLYILPDKLQMEVELLPTLRTRSIFKVPVYNARIKMTGGFKPLSCTALGVNPADILWNEARLVIGIRDQKGLVEETLLRWDQTTIPFLLSDNRGVACNANATHEPLRSHEGESPSSALVATVPISENDLAQGHAFDINLQLRGSEKLFFSAVGTTTKVKVHALWKDRDFQGNHLPDSHSLTDTGFAAVWNIYRAMPPVQHATLHNLDQSTFGVNLIQPLDHYGKTTRTIKYAILVIMLTFVVYFFIELFQKKYANALQYVLIGFALCLFYTLVLSISEFLGFVPAYLISAGATLTLISLYTKSVFGRTRVALVFAGFLGLLYSFIFLLIQLEDGALLVGSIGLFIILASIMMVSRKLEWNKVEEQPDEALPSN